MKKIFIASTLALFAFANVTLAIDIELKSQVSTSARGEITTESVSGVIGKAFILDGSKSQDDGIIGKFTWKQVSGPVVKISSDSSIKSSFTPTTAGTYVFELVVIDNTGLSSTVQKSVFIVGNDAPEVTKTTPITGDPDFDLLSIGDPDFDLLNIDINSDEIAKFRSKVVVIDQSGNTKVTVRGWDTEKKEEIIDNSQNIKTSADFKTYIEAVVLNDDAIKGIKVNKDTIEVESKEHGKLFWFIPVEMISKVIVKYTLTDSTEDVADVDVKFPWWHIFVKKLNDGPDAMETKIKADLSSSAWFKIDNSDTITDASKASQTLEVISNTLKVQHEMSKSIIQNIKA